MRVVHVVNITEKGESGIDRHVFHLATEQKICGFSVNLMVNREGELAEACRKQSIPVDIVDNLRMIKTRDARLASPAAKNVTYSLLTKFESFNPDLIHFHTHPAATHGIPAANLGRIPCIFTNHANKAPGTQGIHPMVAWRQMGMDLSLICVSMGDFEHLKSCGFPEEDLYYVPLGSSAGNVTPKPQRDAPPQNRPNLIFVGSLSIRKRADIAILALAGLRRRYGQDCPVLYLYGDGNEREYLSEIVSIFEMEEVVRFCGFQPNILEWCPDTDILVMSSVTETGPMVVLEAMSRGMPIVATDVGDVASMIPDPRYGRRIRPQSVVALADAIDSLISDINSGRFDPNLPVERHRLLFTVEKMTQRTEIVYSNVLAKKSPMSAARTIR